MFPIGTPQIFKRGTYYFISQEETQKIISLGIKLK